MIITKDLRKGDTVLAWANVGGRRHRAISDRLDAYTDQGGTVAVTVEYNEPHSVGSTHPRAARTSRLVTFTDGTYAVTPALAGWIEAAK